MDFTAGQFGHFGLCYHGSDKLDVGVGIVAAAGTVPEV